MPVGYFLFFFFQAEDGIRDLTVTGVQTCALPICVAVAANGRTLIGPGHRGQAPSLTSLRRGVEVEYASLLPLKNNWRLWQGRPTGQSYAALVNHVMGCTSAFAERVLTAPAALEFRSTEE